jgi:hypothetical protein
MTDDKKPNKNKDTSSLSKTSNAYNKVSKKFQKELFAFIEARKERWDTLPKNKDDLIKLFLNETKNKNTWLHEEYSEYITSISGQTNIDKVAFKDINRLPIGKDGKLSALLAERQGKNFENNKLITVCNLRKDHYTKAIGQTKDKKLAEAWAELIKARFWTESTKKLLSSQKLLPTLQQIFDNFFKKHCDTDKQKRIGTYLSSENNRPTLKHYLDAFAKAGENIQDKNVRDALVKNTKKDWKKIQWVQSLDKSMADLTHFSLLEEWILAREEKTMLIDTFDNTFSHTEISKWIFKDLPRSQYVLEKNAFTVYTEVYDKKIRGAKTEQEAHQRRKLYEKKLLEGYLDRANEQLKKQGKKTPKTLILEQLAVVSKLQEPAFSQQKNNLVSTISMYLQDDYLESQINHDLIKEQFTTFGIENKHFPAYLNFRKQVYRLESNEATLTLWEDKVFTLYADKKLITHPDKFRSLDNLDQLFSFEWTIDFEKSHDIFKTLFWNTPQAYIVDDKHWGILDTINYEHDIPIYLGEATLKNRLLLDKKNEITVTYKTNPNKHKKYTWYPRLDDENDTLHIIDNQWSIVTSIELEKNDDETNTLGIIDSNTYVITATKRTFTQPANPPLITQLIQTAVFNEIVPEDKKIPTKKVEAQQNILQETTPLRPHFSDYVSDIEKEYTNKDATDLEKQLQQEKIGSYRFASTKQIPQKILQETSRRFPGKKDEELSDKVKAWIDKGEIFFHKEYFCKKYDLSNIANEGWKLTFFLQDGTPITIYEISKLRNHDKILNCIQELKSAKVHEVAHRLFEFHGITSISYTTDNNTKITLDQETLCQIVDERSILRQSEAQANKTKRWFININQNGISHRVWLDKLEEKLWEQINWFRRWAIKRLDVAHLEEYKQDYEKFADLVVANTATEENNATPTKETVTVSNQAVTNRLKKFIKQLDDKFDPSNAQHIEQRAKAQQHLDTLTQQKPLITWWNKPTQDELDAMHQQQVEAAQFLQQSSPAQQQRTPRTQEQQTTPANSTVGSANPSPTQSTAPQWSSEETTTSDEEQPQNSVTSNEEEKNKFDAWFAWFKGDSSAKPEIGTVIFLKENISSIPGRGFNWVKYTILWLTNETVTLEMSDASEKQVSKKSTVTIPRTESSLNKLKKIGKNEIYKFGKDVGTKWWFMRSIKSIVESRAEIADFKKTIQDKGAVKKEIVSHVGTLKEKIVSSDRSESVIYKVNRWTTWVTVSSAIPDGDKNNETKKSLWTKKMDYDTFQMFCFTKWLNPLTSTEVQRAGERLDPKKIANDWLPRQWISLAAIRKWLKAIPETYKKKFEEEQEFQTALATDWLSNLIPNTSLFFLDEVKNDLWGTDGLVRQRIQKFKWQRAATGDSDKASIHDNPISEWIKAGVFENIQSTRKYKYKAAGALLYALEKWWPYFRALSEYANKDGWWWWIKCLLGETARQQFLKERKRKIDQFKSMGWSADEIQSEIVKFELQFIQDATTDKTGWWSKFWREIEWHKDTLYGWANSIDPSWFSKKGDFPYMFEAFWWWWIGWNLPWVLFSSLEAMKWAVESSDHYNQFYMCILAIFATGMVHMLPQDYINKLKGIGRSRGIPISLLAWDAHASGKAMRILDHIARNAGIKSFSEFSGNTLASFDQLHIHNTDIKERKSIRDSFWNWWANHGWIVMDAFNYKNNFLIDIPNENDSSLNEEQKKNAKIATDYLWWWWVFGGYKWFQDNESIWSIDGQSPFFQEWLLNLSWWAFRSYMMKFNSQGQLNNDHSVSLWNNFSTMLDQFDTNIEWNKVMTKLLYKKFLQFFWDNELNWMADNTFPEDQKWKSYKELFKMAVKWEIWMNSLIKKIIFKEKERQVNNQLGYVIREDISDTYVKGTILKFAWIIQKSYNNLTDPAHQADIFNE